VIGRRSSAGVPTSGHSASRSAPFAMATSATAATIERNTVVI
jgi:hypothetical protein